MSRSDRDEASPTFIATTASLQTAAGGVNARRVHDPEEVDERGDAVFRFHLAPTPVPSDLSLKEFHRALIQDLLGIVALYSQGRPVLADSFAFLNEPDEVFSILPARSVE